MCISSAVIPQHVCDSPCRAALGEKSTAATCCAAALIVSTVVGPDRRQRQRQQGPRRARLVRQVRAPVFHFCDLGVGVMRIGSLLEPLFLRFLSSLASCSRLGVSIPEVPQELFVALAAVAPHDRAQRRAGLESRAVNRPCLQTPEHFAARRRSGGASRSE